MTAVTPFYTDPIAPMAAILATIPGTALFASESQAMAAIAQSPTTFGPPRIRAWLSTLPATRFMGLARNTGDASTIGVYDVQWNIDVWSADHLADGKQNTLQDVVDAWHMMATFINAAETMFGGYFQPGNITLEGQSELPGIRGAVVRLECTLKCRMILTDTKFSSVATKATVKE